MASRIRHRHGSLRAVPAGLLALLLTSNAAADDATLDARFAELDRAIASADFARADSEAHALLATGGLARDAVVRLHVDLGVVRAARGDHPGAVAEFALALRLDSKAALADAVGPQISEVFREAARDVAREEPVVPTLALTRAPDSTLIVSARVSGNATGLVAAVRVRSRTSNRDFVWDATERAWTRPWDSGAAKCEAYEGSVVDTFGNALWPAAATLGPCESAPPAPSPTHAELRPAPPSSPRPLAPAAAPSATPFTAPFWVAFGTTAALATATGVLGVLALHERESYRSTNREPTSSLDERWAARESALDAEHRATICGIFALAAAGVATTIYLMSPRRVPASGAAKARAPHMELLAGSF